MSVIDTLIITSCIGLSGAQKDACDHALLAGAKQSGIEANVDHMESKTTKKLAIDAQEYLGKTPVDIVAGTAILVKTVADKAATVKLPTMGLCNSLVLRVSQDKSLLSIEWKY